MDSSARANAETRNSSYLDKRQTWNAYGSVHGRLALAIIAALECNYSRFSSLESYSLSVRFILQPVLFMTWICISRVSRTPVTGLFCTETLLKMDHLRCFF